MSPSRPSKGSPQRLIVAAILLFALPSLVVLFGTRYYAPWQPLEQSSRTLELPGDLEERIEQVRRRGSFDLATAPTAALASPRDAPVEAALVPLSPVGTQVRSDRPGFVWSERSPSQGRSLRVEILDANGGIVRTIDADGNNAQPEAALPRGATLTWRLVSEVQAESDSVSFRILAPQEVPELTNRLAELPSDRTLGADLVLARVLILLDYGLLEEARIELREARQLPVDLQVRLRASLEVQQEPAENSGDTAESESNQL